MQRSTGGLCHGARVFHFCCRPASPPSRCTIRQPSRQQQQEQHAVSRTRPSSILHSIQGTYEFLETHVHLAESQRILRLSRARPLLLSVVLLWDKSCRTPTTVQHHPYSRRQSHSITNDWKPQRLLCTTARAAARRSCRSDNATRRCILRRRM